MIEEWVVNEEWEIDGNRYEFDEKLNAYITDYYSEWFRNNTDAENIFFQLNNKL